MAGFPLDVFIAYSRKDEELKDELEVHLASLRNEGKIKPWNDRHIEAGTEWDAVIKQQLEHADLILLLITPRFLASNYGYGIEIKRALERHRAGSAQVIPVIMKPSDWKNGPFKELQVLPRDGKPVTRWADQDEALLDVVNGIRNVLDDVPDSKASKQEFSGNFVESLGLGIDLEIVQIPQGHFWMGSPEDDIERYDRESPLHSVAIQSFGMGKYPVTQAQWTQVAAYPKVSIDLKPFPAHFKGANRPVDQVSWYEAVEFCQRLAVRTGRAYRLPSEAEWEYACRAGTHTPFHFGMTLIAKQANFFENVNETTPVGQFSANALGLHDMHGNVWEWCQDPWHANYEGAPKDGSVWSASGVDEYRVVRGGSWIHSPRYCRSAYRDRDSPDDRFNYIGFRVSCSAPRNL